MTRPGSGRAGPRGLVGARASRIDAATPPERNRLIDAIRVGCLGAVVLGHWSIAAAYVDDGQLQARTLLTVESVHVATWVFQVMPLFFVVGGYANARSLAAHREDGRSVLEWIRRRARALMAPALTLCAVWVVVGWVAVAGGLDPALVAVGSLNALIPLWFLAVYIVAIALAPLTTEAHARWGGGVVVVGIAAVAVIDLLGRIAPPLGWANVVVVWLTLHQIGHLWAGGVQVSRARAVALVAAGLGGAIALVTWADYPLAMVGDLTGPTNVAPPTTALLGLGIAQAGLVALGADGLTRFLDRPVPWAGVVGAGSVAMSVYIWHMTAMVGAALVLFVLGWLPETVPDPWSVTRLGWLAACATVMVPILGALAVLRPRRLELRVVPPSLPATVLGAAALSIGLQLVVRHGLLSPDGAPHAIAAPLLVAGAALLGVIGVPRRRARS